MELISQGAEAKIYREKNYIIKERVKKSYRHEKLDLTLRTKRTKREAKILEKLKDLRVPKLIEVKDTTLKISFIPGKKLSSYKVLRRKHLKELAKLIAELHNRNVIHGDLTTSNVIIKDSMPYLIDFGLSFVSTKIEDKAVDLHLLRQALESKHYKSYEWAWPFFLENYKKYCKEGEKVLNWLEKVEKRGRYKTKK